jgi:hypothetical protein
MGHPTGHRMGIRWYIPWGTPWDSRRDYPCPALTSGGAIFAACLCFMSSAGRPDILQCIRCRDRDSRIAVLHGLLTSVGCLVRCLPLFSCLVLDGLKAWNVPWTISHGISPGIIHGISHGIIHGISHETSHGDPVVYPMGHAME